MKNSNPRFFFPLLVFLPLFCALAACGKKGPLQEVPPQDPLPVKEFDVMQRGPALILRVTLPETLSDKKTAMDLRRLKYLRVYMGARPFGAANYRKKAEQNLRWNADQIQQQGEEVELKIPLKIRQLRGITHYFALEYKYRHHRSPPSKVKTFTTRLVSRRITDLTLKQERKVLLLHWSAPQQNIAGEPVQGLKGYRVYRRLTGPGEKEGDDFTPLNPGIPLYTGFYEDNHTGGEGTCTYYVTALHDNRAESLPSNQVTLKMSNIFPPDPPRNLVCIGSARGLYLSWKPAPDPDIAFYRLYRKTAEEFEFSLLQDRLQKTRYTDNAVQPGILYQYQVTAVDTAGNESPPSNTAREKHR